MQRHHIETFGMFLVAISIQMAALHSWGEVKSTAFVSGVVLQLGSVLKAMYQSSPQEKDEP